MNEKERIFKITDTVWCRTLCTLERMELVVDKCIKRTTLCHDLHEDKDFPKETQDEIEDEFWLQVKALERSWHPIKDDLSYFENDFYEWYAGRESLNLPKSKVDDLAFELLKIIKGEKGKSYSVSSSTPPSVPMSPPDVQGGILGIIDSEHSHKRGAREDGIKRIKRLFFGKEEEDYLDENDEGQGVLK